MYDTRVREEEALRVGGWTHSNTCRYRFLVPFLPTDRYLTSPWCKRTGKCPLHFLITFFFCIGFQPRRRAASARARVIPSPRLGSPRMSGALNQTTWLTPESRAAATVTGIVMALLYVTSALIWLQHRKLKGLLVARRRDLSSPATADDIEEGEAEDLCHLGASEKLGIAFADLHHRQCGHHILKGMTGVINPGDFIGLMGPSGCGKTTLLDVLAGRRARHLTSGCVFANGHAALDPPMAYVVRNSLGYMLQLSNPFSEALTVDENLAYAAMMRLPASMTFEQRMVRVDIVAAQLELTHLRHTVVGGATGGGLSGGQKRKLSLAIEMLAAPAILLLDEPTSGLDTNSSLDVMSALRKYSDSGRAVLVSCHQPRIEVSGVSLSPFFPALAANCYSTTRGNGPTSPPPRWPNPLLLSLRRRRSLRASTRCGSSSAGALRTTALPCSVRATYESWPLLSRCPPRWRRPPPTRRTPCSISSTTAARSATTRSSQT